MGEEVTEQLDYEPARFLCRRIIRRKYVKREEPHQPPVKVVAVVQFPTQRVAPGNRAACFVVSVAGGAPGGVRSRLVDRSSYTVQFTVSTSATTPAC